MYWIFFFNFLIPFCWNSLMEEKRELNAEPENKTKSQYGRQRLKKGTRKGRSKRSKKKISLKFFDLLSAAQLVLTIFAVCWLLRNSELFMKKVAQHREERDIFCAYFRLISNSLVFREKFTDFFSSRCHSFERFSEIFPHSTRTVCERTEGRNLFAAKKRMNFARESRLLSHSITTASTTAFQVSPPEKIYENYQILIQ